MALTVEAGAYALGLLGLASITPSMSVVLWAAEPVLILLLAAAVLHEDVPLALASAIGVAVLGGVLVIYQPGAAGDASLPIVLVHQAAALGFAVALALTVQAAGGHGWSTTSMTPATWMGAAASGILYYGAAFWFYLAGLRQVPASVAGAFLPLISVFGVSVAIMTGERLDPRQWLGAALVVSATLVVARNQERTPPRHERSRE
jgi:probable blue pigment (indigoidine) exporter